MNLQIASYPKRFLESVQTRTKKCSYNLANLDDVEMEVEYYQIDHPYIRTRIRQPTWNILKRQATQRLLVQVFSDWYFIDEVEC